MLNAPAIFCSVITFTLLAGSGTLAQTDTTYATLPKEEIVPGSATNFQLFDDAFYQNRFFLLGESHGVQKPQEVDYELLKHLNQRIGVRYYIAEVDATKAHYLNQYLQTGDEVTLMKVFKSWVDETAQWANKDFYKKIQRIRALNQSLPDSRRIRFVGIDRIQDKPLVADYLTELLRNRKLPKKARPLADSLMTQLRKAGPDSVAANTALAWLTDWQVDESRYQRAVGPVAADLRQLLTNLSYLKTIKGRETTIFTNFITVLPTLNNEKLYGFWGFFHVLQSPTADGAKPFAYRVKSSDLPLRDKIVSITLSYLDK